MRSFASLRRTEGGVGKQALDVQRLAQRAQAGFVEGLAQRRMGVDGAADIFQDILPINGKTGRTTEAHYQIIG